MAEEPNLSESMREEEYSRKHRFDDCNINAEE